MIDGQHRLEAARTRGDIPHLPCIVSRFASIAEEAACFVSINTARRRVTALDTFRAELAAGDETALAIHRLITEAGLTLARHTNNASWRPGQIGAIQGLRGTYKLHGSAIVAAALGDVAGAFQHQPLPLSGALLQGLYLVHARPPESLDVGRFRSMLAERGQEGWYRARLQRQARHGEIPESAMHYALLDAWAAHARKTAA